MGTVQASIEQAALRAQQAASLSWAIAAVAAAALAPARGPELQPVAPSESEGVRQGLLGSRAPHPGEQQRRALRQASRVQASLWQPSLVHSSVSPKSCSAISSCRPGKKMDLQRLQHTECRRGSQGGGGAGPARAPGGLQRRTPQAPGLGLLAPLCTARRTCDRSAHSAASCMPTYRDSESRYRVTISSTMPCRGGLYGDACIGGVASRTADRRQVVARALRRSRRAERGCVGSCHAAPPTGTK